MITFNQATKDLLDGTNFAVVATVNPDGGPQSSVVWAKRDGDTVLFSTLRGRRKALNLRRDPRVSVTVYDLHDPMRYVEIRGHVEITEEGGRALIDELSNKYTGKDFRQEPADAVRVVVRVIPDKVLGYAA